MIMTKNIHILQAKNPQVSAKGQIYLATHDIPDTHYPIRLVRSEPNSPTSHRKECIRQELFITSDEEIREGDWCMSLCDDESYEEIYQCKKAKLVSIEDRKIILTTDIDLIKDGVQSIPDEFLEWFVKNPSCEEVEIDWVDFSQSYFIKIPKEEPKQESVINEKCFKCGNSQYKMGRPFCTDDFCNKDFYEKPKQETLEEAAKKNATDMSGTYYEELYHNFKAGVKWQQEKSYSEEEVLGLLNEIINPFNLLELTVEEWFEQFKKK